MLVRARIRVKVRVRTKSWLVLDFGFLAAAGPRPKAALSKNFERVSQ